MEDTNNRESNYHSGWSSIGSAVREILQEIGKRQVVIRKSSGEKVIEISVLLALILSIGAPVLPVFVVLGVLLETISVSFRRVG